MPHLKAHEMLDLQEHIRSEAASAHSCRQLAQRCQDPDLRRFVENEAQVGERTVQRLMGLLTGGAR